MRLYEGILGPYEAHMKPMAMDVVLKGSQAQRVDLLQAHRVPDPNMGSLEGTAGLSRGDEQLVGVDGHALDVSGVAKAEVDDVSEGAIGA